MKTEQKTEQHINNRVTYPHADSWLWQVKRIEESLAQAIEATQVELQQKQATVCRMKKVNDWQH